MCRRSAGSFAGITRPLVSATIRRRTSGITSRGAATGHGGASNEQQPVHGPERRRHAMVVDETTEACCRVGGPADPEHLVGQALDELTSAGVLDDPAEPPLAATLGPRGFGERPLQEGCGAARGPLDRLLVVGRVGHGVAGSAARHVRGRRIHSDDVATVHTERSPGGAGAADSVAGCLAAPCSPPPRSSAPSHSPLAARPARPATAPRRAPPVTAPCSLRATCRRTARRRRARCPSRP